MKKRRVIVAAVVALVALYFLIPLFRTLPQNRLRNAKSAKLYDINFIRNRSVEGELAVAHGVPLDVGQLRVFAARAEYHRYDPIWKGSALAVVELDDGSTIRVAFSYYGGFYKVLDEPGYWSVDTPQNRELDQWVYRLIVEEFIPRRTASRPAQQ